MLIARAVIERMATLVFASASLLLRQEYNWHVFNPEGIAMVGLPTDGANAIEGQGFQWGEIVQNGLYNLPMVG